VEGFVGGGLLTVLLGTLFTYAIVGVKYLTCPVEVNPGAVWNAFRIDVGCELADIFRSQEMEVGF
jgi:hypothetical protein